MTEDEIDTLNRLVVIFLETAELRAKDRLHMTMSFWKKNVDRILTSNDKKVLAGVGAIGSAEMEEKAILIYEKYDEKRKAYQALEVDRQDLEAVEKQIKARKKE